jgi:hypothetical protein
MSRKALLARLLLAVAVAASVPSCRHPDHQLDLDAIRVRWRDARMRTDTVGDGKFASTATFVLVDAENAAEQGAYVTLGGELTDGDGATLGLLKPQSLWIPPHALRTFALVDRERVARPAATSARITVSGALIPDTPPRAEISELHSFDDGGKVVVQAYLVNAADRRGQVMVVGAFHDDRDRPMTRPFQMIEIAARERRVVQFVGPAGSKKGTIFVGDTIY